MKIGVYICHCGTNIAATVDVEEVAKFAEALPDVAVSRAYVYMCSDPGQELIKKDIRDAKLDRVVVASCSILHGDNLPDSINQFQGNVILARLFRIGLTRGFDKLKMHFTFIITLLDLFYKCDLHFLQFVT